MPYICKKERIIIDEHDIKKLIDSIGYDDLKALKEQAVRKISNVRRRDRLFFTIYLTKEHVESFERAIDWTFEKGLIKRRTRWAFTRFCIVNVISMVVKEIEKEQRGQINNKTSQEITDSSSLDIGNIRHS